jgi:hypothetical protein
MTTVVKTKPFKAVGAFVFTVLAAVLASVAGKNDWGDFTSFQWFVIVLGAIVNAGVVWGITNPPKKVQ